VVIATDKPENVHARMDGPEERVLDVTENPPTKLMEELLVTKGLLPSTEEQQQETTGALFAHTSIPNVVEPNVVIATVKLEPVHARMDGPEEHVLDVTENPPTLPMEAKSSGAQCVHTRKQNAVGLTVVLATNKLGNANAKEPGTVAPAVTEEKSSELDMHVLMLLTLNPTHSTTLLASPLCGLL